MIDIVKEQMIPFSKIPNWWEEHIGHRVNRSTVHRWRLRGARGNKLDTVLIGSRRYTYLEALLRFFDDTTAAEDGSGSPQRHAHQRKREIKDTGSLFEVGGRLSC